MKELIEKSKKEYKKKEKVFCPYFEVYIYLTSAGFNHLIWKTEMGMRPSSVIKERLESLKCLEEILKKSVTLQEVETREGKTFYAFIAIINNKKYKVIVSDTKDGRIIFNSIIPKWITSKRDKVLYKTLNIPETKNPS